jgi:hypothetical protein
MKNNNALVTVRGLAGKLMMGAFFVLVLAGASYAQSGNLYEANGRARFGYITVEKSLFRIDMGGANEIKIFNCSAIPNSGLKCAFSQFMGGRQNYSGEAQVYQSGAVYLRWLININGNQQSRVLDNGWKAISRKRPLR